MTYPEWLPDTDELSSMMRARTGGGEFGATEGVFDETTRPTADQALQAIHDAADIVIVKVGTVTGVASNIAKLAVKVRAAAFIELGYFPEAATAQNSAYSTYMAEFASLIKDAEEAAIESDDGNDPDAGGDVSPLGEFPDGTDYGAETLVW